VALALVSPLTALAKYVPTPQPIKLTPGLSPESIKDAFDKMEAHGDRAEVLYINPDNLLWLEDTIGWEDFMGESRYSRGAKKSWSKGRHFNGSPGDMVCASYHYTEGRPVMGYMWGAIVVGDLDLPMDEIRVRTERRYVGDRPKSYRASAPVDWVELSTKGFFHHTATYTRKPTDWNVVLFVNEKVGEQFFA
jgi:hypothetical protein